MVVMEQAPRLYLLLPHGLLHHGLLHHGLLHHGLLVMEVEVEVSKEIDAAPLFKESIIEIVALYRNIT